MRNTQLKPLTNRSASAETAGRAALYELPADGFYPLASFGRAANEREDGTPIMQVVDRPAADAMMNRMIAEGGEMLIDFDHESRDLDKRTVAAAWLNRTAENLVIRDDGLYGRLRLSGSGEQALVNGDYRFGSPEFADNDALLQKLGGNEVRPLALIGFALTNRPNFRRFAKALTNREEGDAPHHSNANANHTTQTMKPLVAALFGLSITDLDKLDDAALKNRFDDIDGKLKKLPAVEAELATLKNREITEADAFIAEHSAVIPEGTAEIVKEAFLKNREAAKAMVNRFKGSADADAIKKRGERGEGVMKNRETVNPPEANAQAAAEKRAGVIKNRALELQAAAKTSGRELSWQDAFNAASAEVK